MADSLFIVPPKNLPFSQTWMYEAFRRLNARAGQANLAIAAIGRNEAPDGSGAPLIDTSKFFFLPGVQGGQTAFQIDYNAFLLKLTQLNPTANAEPLLIIDSFGKLMRMTTQPFTIANCTTTIGSPTVTTSGSFIQTNGPSVVPGMLVAGTGVPGSTFVRRLTAGNTIEMTQNATANGTVTLTFTTQVDIQPRTDDTGRDIEWLVRGAIRFTAGTSAIPFRINGEEQAPASGIAIEPYVFTEVGFLSGGVSFGLNYQIGGPQHGELKHVVISARTLWLTRSLASGTDNCVGISGSENPATYGAGFGPAASLLCGTNRGPATFVGQGGGPILEVRDLSTGTSPNRVLGGKIFGVDRDNSLGFYPIYFENATGSGMYWRAASNDNLIAYQKSNALEMFSFGRVSTWSDLLAIANSFIHTLGTLNGGHRAYLLTSSGNAAFTRFGIRSAYTVIGNGDISSSDFPAPEANPTLLRVINGVTGGNDSSVLLKIASLRTTQAVNLVEITSAFANPLITGGAALINGTTAGSQIDEGYIVGSQLTSIADYVDFGGSGGTLEGYRATVRLNGTTGVSKAFGSMNGFAGNVSNATFGGDSVSTMRGGFYTVQTNLSAVTALQVGFAMVSNVLGTATTSRMVNLQGTVDGTVTTSQGINLAALLGTGAVNAHTAINIAAILAGGGGGPSYVTLTGFGMGDITRGTTNWALDIGTTDSQLVNSRHRPKISFGTSATPTARVMIGAGTATVPPLQLIAAAPTTSALAGAHEYDGSFFYITPTTLRQAVATDRNVVCDDELAGGDPLTYGGDLVLA